MFTNLKIMAQGAVTRVTLIIWALQGVGTSPFPLCKMAEWAMRGVEAKGRHQPLLGWEPLQTSWCYDQPSGLHRAGYRDAASRIWEEKSVLRCWGRPAHTSQFAAGTIYIWRKSAPLVPLWKTGYLNIIGAAMIYWACAVWQNPSQILDLKHF